MSAVKYFKYYHTLFCESMENGSILVDIYSFGYIIQILKCNISSHEPLCLNGGMVIK